MNLDAQLTELESRLDARIDALLRRAAAEQEGDVSFAVGAAPSPPVDELWALVEQAQAGQGEEEALSFGAPGEEGRLARARRELVELVQQVVESLTNLAVIETGGRRTQVRTQVDWTGDVSSYAVPRTSAEVVGSHAAAVHASLTRSMLRLRLLTTVTTAAAKIATMLTTPGSAVMALPIAYRCVRQIHEQMSTMKLNEDINGGRTSWQ